MYRICGGPETGRGYMYDLFLWIVAFVAKFPVPEVAKPAPELGERHGEFGVWPQQTGEILDNLSEPDN